MAHVVGPVESRCPLCGAAVTAVMADGYAKTTGICAGPAAHPLHWNGDAWYTLEEGPHSHLL